MSEYQPDPSGPQWASAWEYQAGAAAQVLRERGEEPQPIAPPDPRALRRKWRARRIRTIVFSIATFAFIVGAVLDYANGRHNPAGPLVMAGIFSFFAVHQWRRARRMVTPDSGAAPVAPGD